MSELAAPSIRTTSAHGVKLAVSWEKDTRHAGADTWHARSRCPTAGSRPFDRVIACEGRITITSISGNRSGSNARRYAASVSEMQREVGSGVAVDYLDIGHAASNIAGQGQIARVHRPWINRLVEVHVV